jgi:predicted Zn-dependent peptidase
MYLLNIDESYVNNFAANLESVTVEKAEELIAKYFPKENFQFVMVGKGDEIRELVKKYGDVTEISIEDEEFLKK